MYEFLICFRSCYSPTSIEFLKDKDIIDIACGGAHSAAITRSGKLYTWGRGRYGRLGHGTGEDQLVPKLVGINIIFNYFSIYILLNFTHRIVKISEKIFEIKTSFIDILGRSYTGLSCY